MIKTIICLFIIFFFVFIVSLTLKNKYTIHNPGIPPPETESEGNIKEKEEENNILILKKPPFIK